jgi:outer membrane receptor protein involved in Fe transport
MSGFKARFAATSALGLILLAAGWSAPLGAYAQETGDEAASTTVGEVVVTSRKRNEKLTEVPAAVTAITAEQKAGLVLDNLDDYLRQTPSATLVASGPEYLNDITIRGQGGGRLGFSETATGLYRDGLYVAGGGFGGRSLNLLDFFDAGQVEVLRGPQGALFGRNSVGGAVNVISQAPLDETSFRITGRYSDPDRSAGEAVVNFNPIPGVLTLRLGGLIDEQQGGNVVNLTTGNVLDRQRFDGLRAALRWTPSDQLTADFMYERSRSEMPAFANLGRRPLRADGTVMDPSPDQRADMNREGGALIRDESYTASLRYAFNGADLTIKAGYKSRDAGRSGEDNDHFAGQSSIDVTPGAGTGGPDYTVGQFETFDRFVAQAWLASNTGSRLTWLIGVEYLNTRDDVVVEPTLCPAYTGAAQPATPGCFPGLAGSLTGVPAQVRNAARLGLNHDTFTEKLTSPSLFASLEIPFGERTTLGIEARVQRDEKHYTFGRWSEDPLVYFGTGAVPSGMSAPISVDPDGAGPLTASPVEFCPPGLAACAANLEAVKLATRADWTFFTPTLTLRHRFSPDSNAYLRFSTGYRPGGFNTNLGPTTVRAQFAGQLLYEPEYAYSYEAGWKGRLLGFRTAAAIYYTWTNQVQVVTAPSSLSRGFILQNAGDANVYGYELEVGRVFPVGSGDLSLNLALSGQRGEFEQGATALLDTNGDGIPDNLDLEGKAVPRLRDYQLSLNAIWTFPIRDGLKGFVSTSLQSADGGYETPDNSRPYEGYSLIDARVGIRARNLKFSVFGRNLGDDRYVVNVLNTNEYYNERRVLGAELTVEF